MRIETLLFKEIIILPELFLGISLVYLVLHSTFLAVRKNYPLIQTSILYLGVLVLFLSIYIKVGIYIASVLATVPYTFPYNL